MAKRRSIAAELHVGGIDDDELAMVLSDKLPRGAQFGPTEVEYRTMQDETILSLRYRDGKIIDAEAWAAVTPEFEREIRTALDAVCVPGNEAVCRWTMLSGRPVEGKWRYLDEFQIVPAPPKAPRPRSLLADHPFLVDFAFSDSSNQRIRQLRYLRKAADLMLVLNLFLRTRITAPTHRGGAHWVWTPQGSGVFWANEGYIIPNLVNLVSEFPDVDAPSLDEIPADKYYSREGASQTLTIPAELAELLNIYIRYPQCRRPRAFPQGMLLVSHGINSWAVFAVASSHLRRKLHRMPIQRRPGP